MANWCKKIPNWLTFLRLVLIPVFVVLLLDTPFRSLKWAAYIFILAAITDYADGIIARRYAAITDFGKLLDPLADKILVMSALVMLVGIHDDRCGTLVPAWLVVLILAREFWVTGLRAFAAKDGTVVAAKSGGKVKSFLQMVGILVVLNPESSVSVAGMRFSFGMVGLNILVLSVVMSYISAVDYSLLILAPHQGSLTDVTRKIGRTLGWGDGGQEREVSAVKPPDQPEG